MQLPCMICQFIVEKGICCWKFQSNTGKPLYVSFTFGYFIHMLIPLQLLASSWSYRKVGTFAMEDYREKQVGTRNIQTILRSTFTVRFGRSVSLLIKELTFMNCFFFIQDKNISQREL